MASWWPPSSENFYSLSLSAGLNWNSTKLSASCIFGDVISLIGDRNVLFTEFKRPRNCVNGEGRGILLGVCCNKLNVRMCSSLYDGCCCPLLLLLVVQLIYSDQLYLLLRSKINARKHNTLHNIADDNVCVSRYSINRYYRINTCCDLPWGRTAK
jgi:hypothetical protein